jgi:hypothetical protein
MKQIPVLIVLGFALSLCNITERLRGSKSSNSSSSSSSKSESSSLEPEVNAEAATPSAAQTAAIAGGKTAKWDQQGMTFTVPDDWKQVSSDSQQLLWHSPGGFDAANLIVNISPMDASFPAAISLQATYEQKKGEMKNGLLDEVKWVKIDGLTGVQFRQPNPQKPDDFRRLQWIAYRKYAGQLQMVNLMLSTNGKGFPEHQDAMYGVMYSTKLVH